MQMACYQLYKETVESEDNALLASLMIFKDVMTYCVFEAVEEEVEEREGEEDTSSVGEKEFKHQDKLNKAIDPVDGDTDKLHKVSATSRLAK